MASDNIALDGVGSTNVKSLTFFHEKPVGYLHYTRAYAGRRWRGRKQHSLGITYCVERGLRRLRAAGRVVEWSRSMRLERPSGFRRVCGTHSVWRWFSVRWE